MFSISPSLNSTFLKSYFFAVSRALQIISGVASTPITLPADPSVLEALKTSMPPPLPKSKIVSFPCSVIRLSELPQLAPTASASLGMIPRSDEGPLQHELAQHDTLC